MRARPAPHRPRLARSGARRCRRGELLPSKRRRVPAVARGERRPRRRPRRRAPVRRARDYVGSAAPVRACHPKEERAWANSPMHRMTRLADAPDVSAPFDGREMRFHGDIMTLEEQGGRRFVRIEHTAAAPELFLVTRVIGGRTREDFAGVRVNDGERRDGRAGDETVLPVSVPHLLGQASLQGVLGPHPRKTRGASRPCLEPHLRLLPQLERRIQGPLRRTESGER